MEREQFNNCLFWFTVIVAVLAILLIFLVYCLSRLDCVKNMTTTSRPRPRKNPNKPCYNPTIVIDIPDLDFIDARNSDLVGSPVLVKSLHNSPVSLQ